MLKAFKSSWFTVESPLTQVIRFSFSAKSKRDRVPNILKHPKFTREGISKKKKKSYQYDLTQPHIQFPERYYNEAVDKKAERKAYLERKKLRRTYEDIPTDGARPLENILKDLTNNDFLHQGSSRLINNIHELEKNYSAQLDDPNIKDIIVRAIQALTSRVYQKNFRELGIITTLNKKYGITDKNAWKDILSNVIRFIKREENDSFKVFGSETNEDNFVHTVCSIIQVSRYNGLDTTLLLQNIEQNYLAQINQFRSLKNLVLFTTALSNSPAMKNRTAFWSAIEKEVLGKLNEINAADAVALIYTFSKVKHNTDAIDKLVGKFLENYGKIEENKLEKIAIVAISLANLKKKNDKFNILAEKEVEAQLNDLTQPIDIRFILSSFPRLGIKSKKILDHCEKHVIEGAGELTLSNIEQIVTTTQATKFSKGFYDALGGRLNSLVEENLSQVDKSKGEHFLSVLQKWESAGLYKNEELVTRLRDHIKLL